MMKKNHMYVALPETNVSVYSQRPYLMILP